MRVVILGGGISGLIAHHVFQRHRGGKPANLKLVEPGKVGGEFTSGGLKYIHRTDGMVRLIGRMGLPFSSYRLHGGILLRGKVQPYPQALQKMAPEEALRVQQDHYVKTRKTQSGSFGRKAMNDPTSSQARHAIRTDFESLVEKLARGVAIVPEAALEVNNHRVRLSGGNWLDYDVLIATIPLWILRRICSWYLPEGFAMKLNIAWAVPERDVYAAWDFVYTPYTPSDYIHRFSPAGLGYMVEANGELDHLKLESDLQFIFQEGYYIKHVRAEMKGHLLPMNGQAQWPENVAPLGRFAQWDPRATMDTVLDGAEALAKRWLE